MKVWEALLKIPMGGLNTYGSIAQKIDSPKASRAVGTAIGDNPVAFLIPCHRVIRSTGEFGGYHWGATRKSAIIGWEAAQVNPLATYNMDIQQRVEQLNWVKAAEDLDNTGLV